MTSDSCIVSSSRRQFLKLSRKGSIPCCTAASTISQRTKKYSIGRLIFLREGESLHVVCVVRFDLPAAVINTRLELAVGGAIARQTGPILARNARVVEHVGDQFLGAKSGYFVGDHPQFDRLGELLLFPLAAAVFGSPIHPLILRSQAADTLQVDFSLQRYREVSAAVLDVPQQAVTPKAGIQQYQIVPAQMPREFRWEVSVSRVPGSFAPGGYVFR